ncbi:MAG TPA: HXXEE domain-containing protein [Blastocatellia bacterium]|nr:HXXEE domain-containing protein [Blastocatellia bacterium]
MSRAIESLTGGVFVLAAILLHVRFMGVAMMGLNVGLVIAYLVWLSREDGRGSGSSKVLSIYLTGIAVQCAHFCEEYLTGFQTRFPGLAGYRWSDGLFVAFNLIWLCWFVLAAVGGLYRVRLAYLVVWFFALAGGIGNGIVHPVLSIIQGGYFPGLITSPAHLIIGILLTRALVKARRGAKG